MTEHSLGSLLGAALRLEPSLPEEDRRHFRDCVITPLASVAAPTPAEEARLWSLALIATQLLAAGETSPALKEAAAALQHLGVQAGAGSLEELRHIQADLDVAIEVADDGPYLATNVELYDWLGERVDTCPQVALCRCGASAIKPLCDGSHRRIGFSGDKDPKRVPDRRDSYDGVTVTVLDNRGTCAHSGFCTDRLASVFRLGQEPFVAPSGGRMDEIVAAVRACPSGALSLAIDGHELRQVVDQPWDPAVQVSKDGPYRVTGAIPLTASRNEGASLEHYSLCRCGHSLNKPFCSGMHWNTTFKDPEPASEPTLFEWAGGLPALTRMTRLFYDKYVPEDPLLGPLFATMAPDHPVRVARWLGEVFGGPPAYTDNHGGYSRMIAQHMGKCLTEEQRARWVALMGRAADQSGLPGDAEFRAAFTGYLEWGSRIALENSQIEAKPPAAMPVPQWWWVCNATPDSRISALTPPSVEEMPLPDPGSPISFEAHIKPLFRAQDRNSMRFAFDLWSYEDVRTHAPAILERLHSGTMPCDTPWPPDRIAVFQRWIEMAMAE